MSLHEQARDLLYERSSGWRVTPQICTQREVKRTAAIAMEAFLLLNGYKLRMSDDEIAELFETLGSDKIGQDEFFYTISTHSHPAEPSEREPS